MLFISTDSALNLDGGFKAQLASKPTVANFVPNLWVMNIDPEEVARDYLERMVVPYRGALPDAVLQRIEEQFLGSGTVEIADFDEPECHHLVVAR